MEYSAYSISLSLSLSLSLSEYLIQNGKMDESEARVKFREIVLAVDYCHKKGIVHRDLKVHAPSAYSVAHVCL